MATQNQNQNQNHHEKKKRGFIMSFCKSRSSHKNSTPKSPEPAVVPIKPVVVSESLLPRKSINGQETKPSARRGIEAEGGGGDGGGEGRRGNNVEARKSVSQVETNLASVAAFLQVKVLVTDMPGFMQVHAFRCARRTHDSLEKFSSKHMAYNIKKEFDKVYGPAWHCIVGSSFGSFVTHSTGCFLYFSMDKLYILVFKTKVQKALD